MDDIHDETTAKTHHPAVFQASSADRPLVSIFSFCKNRAHAIRRSVESVLNQSYQNIEFVVQDGASTDGTLEILQSYGSRIRLVSEPDSGPPEGFWKALNRCTGDIIGTCLSDDELLPDAVETAVKIFRAEPQLGALTCDGYLSDIEGKITGDFIAGEFSLAAYLFSNYCPFWQGSFFRRKALLAVGLLDPGWNIECLEFEVWCRLGCDEVVKYVPAKLAKYAIHEGQLSNTPAKTNKFLDGRLALVEKMFSKEGFFGADEDMKLRCMINQTQLFYDHARAYHFEEAQAALGRRLDALARQRSMYDRFASYSGSLSYATKRHAMDSFFYMWSVVSHFTPKALRKRVPLKLKLWVHDKAFEAFLILKHFPTFLFWSARRLLASLRRKPQDPEFRASDLPEICNRIALLYEARGQIAQALEMWRGAEPLGDRQADSLAAQAALKLPDATYQDFLDIQILWARRHTVRSQQGRGFHFRRYDEQRKIRVGYHCSFMNGDTIRFQMRNVIAAHDRTRFDVIGYSPAPLPTDIRSAFDVVRDTGNNMRDSQFVDQVRKDQIDVLVELTGFSPGHRFGAMSARCAPVQISYLNHHGTTGVANIDYILSDEIATPRNIETDSHFTEQICRLPGCFFCFDYEGSPAPSVLDPPSLKSGFVTFGCFGSGSKINPQLIELWAQLLHRVPGAIFFIRNRQLDNPDNRRYLKDRFRRFGIPAERLKLAGGCDRYEILESYAEVDISMDTWPYCGGNTIAEALWQGVPVITCRGSTMPSSYGASLVTAAGCGDLVGNSFDEYLSLASALAQNPEHLLYLRHNLRRMCKEHGLSDSVQFSRRLEDAYIDLRRRADV
ncbi:MAG TPA: glycosyltransferase [Stellaceae bacterium]|jgi:glycosyltransferase involved in cell wall biosynthesis|nr:glycosyltransferase [Stellaceae bacterium]